MTPFDLVVILLIPNSLQNAMVGPDTPWPAAWLLPSRSCQPTGSLPDCERALPWLRRVAEGEPILLVSGGKVLNEHLRRSSIDLDDLEQAVREDHHAATRRFVRLT